MGGIVCKLYRVVQWFLWRWPIAREVSLKTLARQIAGA
jgi:hypothetical protein